MKSIQGVQHQRESYNLLKCLIQDQRSQHGLMLIWSAGVLDSTIRTKDTAWYKPAQRSFNGMWNVIMAKTQKRLWLKYAFANKMPLTMDITQLISKVFTIDSH